MREALKACARGVSTIVVLPLLLSFFVRRAVMGSDRALQGTSQLLALVPGLVGQYLRRAFLARALDGSHTGATVGLGTLL